MDEGVASSEAQLDSDAEPEATASGAAPAAPEAPDAAERDYAALNPAPGVPLRIDPLGRDELAASDSGLEDASIERAEFDSAAAELPADAGESAEGELDAVELDWPDATQQVDRRLPLEPDPEADDAASADAAEFEPVDFDPAELEGGVTEDRLAGVLPVAPEFPDTPEFAVAAEGDTDPGADLSKIELPDVDDGAEVPELTEPRELSRVLMAVLLSSREPIKLLRLAEICNSTQKCVSAALDRLHTDLAQAGMPLEVLRTADAARLATAPAVYGYLTRMRKVKRAEKLSPAALETLAVVAYRQPVIRAEIEAIRGVKVGPMLKTLLDHKLVTVVGREDVPGRPLQYGTTQQFLDRFGLASIDELPSVQEFRSLS